MLLLLSMSSDSWNITFHLVGLSVCRNQRQTGHDFSDLFSVPCSGVQLGVCVSNGLCQRSKNSHLTTSAKHCSHRLLVARYFPRILHVHGAGIQREVLQTKNKTGRVLATLTIASTSALRYDMVITVDAINAVFEVAE